MSFSARAYNRAGVIVYSQEEDGTMYILMGKSRISNKFGDFGGKIEEGETEVEAALRELREETSENVQQQDIKKYRDGYFHLKIEKQEFTIKDTNPEISELRWFNFDYIRENLYETVNYSFRWMIKQFLERPPGRFQVRFKETTRNKATRRKWTTESNPRFACLLH